MSFLLKKKQNKNYKNPTHRSNSLAHKDFDGDSEDAVEFNKRRTRSQPKGQADNINRACVLQVWALVALHDWIAAPRPPPHPFKDFKP